MMTILGIVYRVYNREYKKFHQIGLTVLKEFGFGSDVMETRIHRETEILFENVDKLNGRHFHPLSMVTCFTMNILTGIIFGRRFEDSENSEFGKLFEVIETWVREHMPELDLLPALRHLPQYRMKIEKLRRLDDKIFKYIDDGIDAASKDKTAKNFASRFMEMEGESEKDRAELRYIIRDFLIAGTHASSTAVQWALISLANHPSVQERLRNEVDSVVQRELPPSLNDKPSMPYAEATVLELLRWKTLVAAPVHFCRHDTEIGGYFIPASSMVLSKK